MPRGVCFEPWILHKYTVTCWFILTNIPVAHLVTWYINFIKSNKKLPREKINLSMYSHSIRDVYLLNLRIQLGDRKKIKIDVMWYIDFLLIEGGKCKWKYCYFHLNFSRTKNNLIKRTHARQLGLTNIHGRAWAYVMYKFW